MRILNRMRGPTFLLALAVFLPPTAGAALRDRASPEAFSAYVRGYETPQLFETNSLAFDARLKLLDAAPKGAHVRIATFEFHNGEATRRLSRHVCLAAQRGVRVELITDSKTGDRAGEDDAFDGNDDAQVGEELLQYMANCGAEVRIYNPVDAWISVLGQRLPNFFVDPERNGKSVFPLIATLKLDRVLQKVSRMANEELFRVGITADSYPLFNALRAIAFEMLQLSSVVKNARYDDAAPDGYENSVRRLEMLYLDALADPFWLSARPDALKVAVARFVVRLRQDPDLRGLYEVVRRFNRVQHRKIFAVENGSEACLILGGRNLGDAYLTDGPNSFVDGDVLLCRHHGADAARAVDEGIAAWQDLLSDRSDSLLGRAKDLSVHLIEKNPSFPFANLLFPAALAPKGLRTAPYRGSLAREKRTLLPERAWRDDTSVQGDAAIGKGRNWRVLRASWNPAADEVRSELLRRIGAEQREIYLETAYAEFGPELRQALEGALARGVRVRLVTNSFFLTDGISKLIRVLMAHWVEAVRARYPDRFQVLLTSYAAGHMTHFKGAAFACQPAIGGSVRSYLLGSHNFHPRSGRSDKESSFSWEEPSGCEGLSIEGTVRSREAYYQGLSERLRTQVLVDYPTLHDELASATSSGHYDVHGAPTRWISRALRRVLYLEGERGVHLREEKRVEFILRLLDRSGLHDLLGLLL